MDKGAERLSMFIAKIFWELGWFKANADDIVLSRDLQCYVDKSLGGSTHFGANNMERNEETI